MFGRRGWCVFQGWRPLGHGMGPQENICRDDIQRPFLIHTEDLLSRKGFGRIDQGMYQVNSTWVFFSWKPSVLGAKHLLLCQKPWQSCPARPTFCRSGQRWFLNRCRRPAFWQGASGSEPKEVHMIPASNVGIYGSRNSRWAQSQEMVDGLGNIPDQQKEQLKFTMEKLCLNNSDDNHDHGSFMIFIRFLHRKQSGTKSNRSTSLQPAWVMSLPFQKKTQSREGTEITEGTFEEDLFGELTPNELIRLEVGSRHGWEDRGGGKNEKRGENMKKQCIKKTL